MTYLKWKPEIARKFAVIVINKQQSIKSFKHFLRGFRQRHDTMRMVDTMRIRDSCTFEPRIGQSQSPRWKRWRVRRSYPTLSNLIATETPKQNNHRHHGPVRKRTSQLEDVWRGPGRKRTSQLEDVWRQTMKAGVCWIVSGRRPSSPPGQQPPSVHGITEPCTTSWRQHK